MSNYAGKQKLLFNKMHHVKLSNKRCVAHQRNEKLAKDTQIGI